MPIRPTAIVLLLTLTLTATLRAADTPATEPAFQQPAAFQALLKLGAATQAIYALFPNETYLTFANDWKGTEADLTHFNELATTSTVNIIGDKNAAMILPHLAEMPMLQHVGLSDVTLSPAQINLLAPLKLKSLSICSKATTLSLDGLANIEMLSLGGTVEHLTLTNVPALEYLNIQAITKAPTQLTLDIPDAPRLKALVLKNLTLLDFPLSPSLEWVDFDNSTVPDALLLRIPQLKNLNSLDLTGVQNANITLSRLVDSHLKLLFAADAHVTDEAIGAIKDLSHIENLNLGGNHDFTGKTLAPVGTANENFLQVIFAQTAVTDDVLATLENAKTSGLSLYLDESKITDAAMARLAKMPHLYTLSLTRTAVTDAGLYTLAASPRLGQLWLSQTPTTAAGIDALRKSLPKIQIYSNFQSAPTPEK